MWDDGVLYVKIEVVKLTLNERVMDDLVRAARGKQEIFEFLRVQVIDLTDPLKRETLG